MCLDHFIPWIPVDPIVLLHVYTNRRKLKTTRTAELVEHASCQRSVKFYEHVQRNHRRRVGIRWQYLDLCLCAARMVHFRCLAVIRPDIGREIHIQAFVQMILYSMVHNNQSMGNWQCLKQTNRQFLALNLVSMLVVLWLYQRRRRLRLNLTIFVVQSIQGYGAVSFLGATTMVLLCCPMDDVLLAAVLVSALLSFELDDFVWMNWPWKPNESISYPKSK